MRSSPTDNKTLLRIQQEINEVAERENELRNNTAPNGLLGRSPSPVEHDHPPPTLTRAVSTSALNTAIAPASNGIAPRRFIPNTAGAKGVMQKFFKSRGKIAATVNLAKNPSAAWQSNGGNNGTLTWQQSSDGASPTLALIPTDKPLRKGYVPVEERIQKELREMKNREDELKVIRRKSQPDLMAALEAESNSSSRSTSPIGRLRPARSYSQLLVDDDLPEDTMSAPSSLRPARSLAELCNAADEEIESPRSLIRQWESRIKQSNDQTATA